MVVVMKMMMVSVRLSSPAEIFLDNKIQTFSSSRSRSVDPGSDQGVEADPPGSGWVRVSMGGSRRGKRSGLLSVERLVWSDRSDLLLWSETMFNSCLLRLQSYSWRTS